MSYEVIYTMELLQLRIFVKAAKTLSFTKTSQALFISPSSISKYITALESEVAQPLFVRIGNKIALTTFGYTFLSYAEDLLKKEDDIYRFLEKTLHSPNVLHIGVSYNFHQAPFQFYSELFHAKQAYEQEYSSTEIMYHFYGDNELGANFDQSNVDYILLSINNSEVPGKIAPGVAWKKVKNINYYLAAMRPFDSSISMQEIASQLKSVAYVDSPASRKLAHYFVEKYNITPKITPLMHFGDGFFKMAAGECSFFVFEDAKETVEKLGATTYLLDSKLFSSGIYIFWREDNLKPNIEEFPKFLIHSFSKEH